MFQRKQLAQQLEGKIQLIQQQIEDIALRKDTAIQLRAPTVNSKIIFLEKKNFEIITLERKKNKVGSTAGFEKKIERI